MFFFKRLSTILLSLTVLSSSIVYGFDGTDVYFRNNTNSPIFVKGIYVAPAYIGWTSRVTNGVTINPQTTVHITKIGFTGNEAHTYNSGPAIFGVFQSRTNDQSPLGTLTIQPTGGWKSWGLFHDYLDATYSVSKKGVNYQLSSDPDTDSYVTVSYVGPNHVSGELANISLLDREKA